MAGLKKFGNSVLGFKRADVNSYIERILKEFEEKIKIKDREIEDLKGKYRDIKFKYDSINRGLEQMNQGKSSIADVLIKAQQKADMILEEAKAKSEEEKNKIIYQIESDRQRLNSIKEDAKILKSYFISNLEKYREQMDEIVGL